MGAMFQWLLGRLRHSRYAAVDEPLLDAAAVVELARRVDSLSLLPATVEIAHGHRGEARSGERGRGLDFDESRPYQPGDDGRMMDWRATARAGQPYTKIFREERRPTMFVLLDRRSAMRFGTHVRLKVAQAARAAILLAFAAQRRQAMVTGLLLERPLHWIAPSATPDAVLSLAMMAASSAPPLPQSAEPTLAEVLVLLARSLERGTELWLLSDFHDLDTTCRSLLLRLSAEHNVHAVHAVDPVELYAPHPSLPSEGRS